MGKSYASISLWIFHGWLFFPRLFVIYFVANLVIFWWFIMGTRFHLHPLVNFRVKVLFHGWFFIFQRCVGANKITWATLTCFCDCFWENILEIFLKNSSNFVFHTILLRFMLKFWQKMSFSKKLKSICKSFYYLKTNDTMFNDCFFKFFIHWINLKLIHMFPWYIKNKTI
jgi:hypothetical protein